MADVVNYKGYDVIPCYDTYKPDNGKRLKALECKHVRHIPKSSTNEDTHIINLVHHYTDDTSAKEIRIVENYKRQVWITKPIFRTYKDKKEFEHEDRLGILLTTQSDIVDNCLRALDKPIDDFNRRSLKDSPYLYGYDVPSTSLIKYHYSTRNDGYLSEFKVLDMDIEADVTGISDVTIITLSTEGFRHLAVSRRLFEKFYKTDEDIKRAIIEKRNEVLPKTPALEKYKISDISIHNSEKDLIEFVHGMVHIIKPDFVDYHNMAYDVGKYIDRCIVLKIKIEDLLCDPSIPTHLKNVDFRVGKAYKIKKGKKVGLPIEEQWTTVNVSASFMIMDRMTMYNAIRNAQGKVVGGYGLDNLAKVNGLVGKIDFDPEVAKLSKILQHAHMATKKPVEYAVYADYDTIVMTDLEMVTGDFSLSLPVFAGIADFNRFNSSVHLAVCRGFVENKPKGLVIGTAPANPIDRSYLTTKDWIKTLPSDHIQDIGLWVTNLPCLPTNVTAHADDLDCVSSYPSDIQATNVSIDTLAAEVTGIEGIAKETFKCNNINLITSNANVLEYCNIMMNLPTAIEMLDLSAEEYKKANPYSL